MSSDSDDDCYGNLAQKLQSMKSMISADRETDEPASKAEADNSWRKNYLNDSQNSAEGDGFSLDQIIADNSKKKAPKRTVEVVDNSLSKKKRKSSEEAGPSCLNQGTSSSEGKRARGRGRGLGRGRAASKRGRRKARNDYEISEEQMSVLEELMTISSTINNLANITAQSNLPVPDQIPKVMVPCHVSGLSNPGIPIEVRDSMMAAANIAPSINTLPNLPNDNTVTDLVNSNVPNPDANNDTTANINATSAIDTNNANTNINPNMTNTNVADVINPNVATTNANIPNINTVANTTDTSVNDTSIVSNSKTSKKATRARGRSRASTRNIAKTNNTDVANTINTNVADSINANLTNQTNTSVVGNTTSSRGRSRGRARGRNKQSTPRGSSRRRGPRWQAPTSPTMYDFLQGIANSLAYTNYGGGPSGSSSGPVYSIGNTDEYPDESDNLPLFTAPKKTNDVVIVEENDHELDDNEEMSVKVYWQSSEHVKFNIRRFQKITQIFDHFAERENVSKDKLFFTYNDKILKSDDTPDSIGYSIAKFIDGGIVEQSVSSIVKNTDKEERGIKLKFQCKNAKKPFIATLKPDDRMQVVMTKCAEHLEKPLDKLKFHFDGDLISGKTTAMELELEGGECIDVTISS